MPGTKDNASINTEGKKVHLQEQPILCNLKEACVIFNKQNPEKLLIVSTFLELQPKNFVLAGSSGTHAVCVRSTHQNVKL
jgi:hypothetical protein